MKTLQLKVINRSYEECGKRNSPLNSIKLKSKYINISFYWAILKVTAMRLYISLCVTGNKTIIKDSKNSRWPYNLLLVDLSHC